MKLNFTLKILSFSISLFLLSCTHSDKVIDLSGEWTVCLDSLDQGESKNFSMLSFSQSIELPGTTDQAEIGVEGNTVLGLTTKQLTTLTRKNRYVGAAWYTKAVTIPSSWEASNVVLKLERIIWRSDVWIDGEKVDDSQESLVTPHYYDLTNYLSPGEHRITIRIDNRKQHSNSYKDLAHAYTDHTQIMWNGILGEITLTKYDDVKISNVSVTPNITEKRADLAIILSSEVNSQCDVTYEAVLRSTGESYGRQVCQVDLKRGDNTFDLECLIGDEMQLWSEFTPELYDLNVDVKVDGLQIADYTTSFGMYELTTDGNVMLMNGNPIFLRGTLECCIFPLTGCPPMTKEGWGKVFDTAKSWGLNHLRFHSWCPPKAAFEKADEMGFYLQVELPVWALDIGQDVPSVDFFRSEGDAILAEYGNHPSFSFFCLGNELQGDFAVLEGLMRYYKAKDSKRLYATTAFTFEKGHGVWPEPEDDFFLTQWTNNGWVRGQGVFNQESPTFNRDYGVAVKGMEVPLITHEIGQYSVYPQMSEIEKYTGVLDPINFKSISADLIEKGLFDRAAEFTYSSGKFASILYKEEIERALKTDGISGFQLLDLHDFPGQGTALVGLLDAFWDSKGVISAEQFSEFCGPVTPLLRFAKATYKSNEEFVGQIDLSNFSSGVLADSKVIWTMYNQVNEVVASGDCLAGSLPIGYNSNIGEIKIDLSNIERAEKMELVLSVDGTDYRNRWNIWVYPSDLEVSYGDVKYTRNYNTAIKLLQQGEKVLYNPDWKEIKGIEGKFVPVFWSPVHFPKQAGTMGVLCDPLHPVFNNFPTGNHSDWQWWDLNVNSTTMIVDEIKGGSSLVDMIDNFVNNRRLSILYEGQVGAGKLIISSIDLSSKLDDRVTTKQLLHSVLEYMNDDNSFNPSEISNIEVVEGFLQSKKIGTKESATSIY